MALNQTNKLVWIVDTIRRYERISFEDLNRKWVSNVDLSGGEEMLKRTFHKWRYNILDTFGLNIECETGGQYRYYITNSDDLRRDSVENWLLSTYSVTNSLQSSKSIKNRILLEDIPSGVKLLDEIVSAMKHNKLIHISYYNYRKGRVRKHYVMPLCVKLFRQRWYVVGKAWRSGQTMVFSLDRIREFRPSSHSFEYPNDFDAQVFFEGCIGVIAGVDGKLENVKLKVDSVQANYLRDLPIHRSQEEIERNDEYSIFQLYLRPTFDFEQEILWNGDSMEVLEPLWLRNKIAGRVERMWRAYHREESRNSR